MRDIFKKLTWERLKGYLRGQFWENDEPISKKAYAVALGVFMGIAPIWGFQMLTALGLAFLLRLNKALVILATNISIPPMIPLILFLSHLAGKPFMGNDGTSLSFSQPITLEIMEKNFLQYVIGAFTLAATAALFFGSLTFALLKILKR